MSYSHAPASASAPATSASTQSLMYLSSQLNLLSQRNEHLAHLTQVTAEQASYMRLLGGTHAALCVPPPSPPCLVCLFWLIDRARYPRAGSWRHRKSSYRKMTRPIPSKTRPTNPSERGERRQAGGRERTTPTFERLGGTTRNSAQFAPRGRSRRRRRTTRRCPPDCPISRLACEGPLQPRPSRDYQRAGSRLHTREQRT